MACRLELAGLTSLSNGAGARRPFPGGYFVSKLLGFLARVGNYKVHIPRSKATHSAAFPTQVGLGIPIMFRELARETLSRERTREG